jgi:hypothetical protein
MDMIKKTANRHPETAEASTVAWETLKDIDATFEVVVRTSTFPHPSAIHVHPVRPVLSLHTSIRIRVICMMPDLPLQAFLDVAPARYDIVKAEAIALIDQALRERGCLMKEFSTVD